MASDSDLQSESLYRFSGDLQFDSGFKPDLNKALDVKLKPYTKTVNFLQYMKPLTPDQPYFCAEIKSLADGSVVTIGIAGPDISTEVHPGHWNKTVGYHSDTGMCYSSHNAVANTDGGKFGVGDTFGVLVTYFGKNCSTVMFLKNGSPVGTRYLFEIDHSKFLPAIAMENGPIELGLIWPQAIVAPPRYSIDVMLHWIRPQIANYDSMMDEFSYEETDKYAFCVIQSPFPLSRSVPRFEITLTEDLKGTRGPTIGLATCSPMDPSPTCDRLRDYLKWQPAINDSVAIGKGTNIGWGVHYNPERRKQGDFDDKELQLVLCYVTVNATIVYAEVMYQPVGGWYPIVMLLPLAARCRIAVPPSPKKYEILDELFQSRLESAMRAIEKDHLLQEIKPDNIRLTDGHDLAITDDPSGYNVSLPEGTNKIYCVQYQKPLNVYLRYYRICINKLSADSVVCYGVAGPDFPLNKMPGKEPNTVGFHSKDRKMYTSTHSDGNIHGEKFQTGDVVGLEILSFGQDGDPSVVLFTKNNKPIGTRYLFETNHDNFLPTVAICGGGKEVDISITWHTRIQRAVKYDTTSIENWCLPSTCKITDPNDGLVEVMDQTSNDPLTLQSPYSLNDDFNHFEITLIDDFSEDFAPPLIALSCASPMHPVSESSFKQDYISFWAKGEAQKVINKGDNIGWGMLVVDRAYHSEERNLVICYLTRNRDVALMRVMFEPPGGYFPVVVIPPHVRRVKMDFTCSKVVNHPFTEELIKAKIDEAIILINEERKQLSQNQDLPSDLKENKELFLVPSKSNDTENKENEKSDIQHTEDKKDAPESRFEVKQSTSKDKDEFTSLSREPSTCDSEQSSSGKQSKPKTKSKTCTIL